MFDKVVGANSTGTITNTNYPMPYPYNVEFHYNLRAPLKHQIFATLHLYNVRGSVSCAMDYVTVQDPYNETPVHRMCGPDVQYNFTSYLNYISLTFRTGPEGNHTDVGFEFRYFVFKGTLAIHVITTCCFCIWRTLHRDSNKCVFFFNNNILYCHSNTTQTNSFYLRIYES